jgi:hypothetical protein
MIQTRILLDPTAEQTPALREKAARLSSLNAQTIGLLDISKADITRPHCRANPRAARKSSAPVVAQRANHRPAGYIQSAR